MFQKIIQLVPAPTLIGFVLSIVAVLIGWIFSVSATMVFLVLITLVCLAWGLQKEYKLPMDNNLLLIGGMLLGHVPYLLIKIIF